MDTDIAVVERDGEGFVSKWLSRTDFLHHRGEGLDHQSVFLDQPELSTKLNWSDARNTRRRGVHVVVLQDDGMIDRSDPVDLIGSSCAGQQGNEQHD